MTKRGLPAEKVHAGPAQRDAARPDRTNWTPAEGWMEHVRGRADPTLEARSIVAVGVVSTCRDTELTVMYQGGRRHRVDSRYIMTGAAHTEFSQPVGARATRVLVVRTYARLACACERTPSPSVASVAYTTVSRTFSFSLRRFFRAKKRFSPRARRVYRVICIRRCRDRLRSGSAAA